MRASCLALALVLACSCSSSGGSRADGAAGRDAPDTADGPAATGGSPASGGTIGTGGIVRTGGLVATGGVVDTGGSSSGGSNPTGGARDGGVDQAPDADAAGGAFGTGGTTMDASQTDSAPAGTTDVWTQLTLPSYASGDYYQSLVVDPVNPGTLITASGNNDARAIKWYRTTDYGDTWTLVNNSDMRGNPWGFSIDPNPSRDPSTPPTLYSPAGYGSLGAWKSTDGASTWTRLTGADTAYSTYNPFGSAVTDLYHVAVLPDDPPNHILATYHYYFKDRSEGGFGESWDGGATWVVHPPVTGMGTSHYVLPISATTWCVISQEVDSGMWRTTTAGRTGGTAALKFRDGTISTSAWAQVSQHAHIHGAYTPVKVGNAWYSPGLSASEGSIWKTTDEGATWIDLVPGYYWPSPPNPAFMNKNVTGLAATATYLYSNTGSLPELARAPIANDSDWRRNYTTSPADLTGGANPLGTVATRHAASGHWMVFMATSNGVWRYIEP